MNTSASPIYSARRAALWQQAKTYGIAALLVTHATDYFYLSGFTGDSGALLISRKGATLITDGRFAIQARQEAPGVEVFLQKTSLFESAGKFIAASGVKSAGFDPAQLSVAQLTTLRKAATNRCLWKPVGGLVAGLRALKAPQELAAMRRSALLAGEVMNAAITLLKPGVREFEVAAEIEYQMKKRGASGAAFETIVAFGERSALPHARPTSKRLKKNELAVLDLGAILAHYCSDISRTVYLGKMPPRLRHCYQGVLEAQSAAIAAVRNGVTCGDIDAAARQVLVAYKLDQYFVHSTGHGLGLEVHEEPRVARGQKKRLEAGNVITIEPGVYIQGVGGIRIEDDVAVHANRTEVLTRIPRELIEL